MGETQEKQHHISFEEEADKGADYMANSSNITISQSLTSWRAKYKRWLEIGFNSLLVLICLSVATLLGELYYKEGGKSTWVNSLVQTGGFPVLFPILFLKKREETQDDDNARNNKNPSVWMFLSVYVFLGLLLGGSCMLNAVGLLHLPVSTFSLIAASQLGFNALFSFFLNSQKITTYIANSIILLTISSILLVFQPIDSSSGNGESSKGKSYTIGFICTLFGSAGMALLLSTTERIFRKIMKKRTVRQVMNVVIWQSFFATCAILIGLFATGEWKWMKSEIQEYKLGKVSYVMTLVWTALCWQIYTIGLLNLIMKVSALFANVITTLSVPLIPVLAVIIFDEKMSGVKAVSMILALWGFLSYGYQQYLDELKLKAEKSAEKEESEVSLVERGLSGGN
ncbi:purine permease 21-like [Nicotiana sylvestris]|uniref:Probable purine permease n=1 Tax=Nicotiana sylvestris TaxID=4096 RepID=A0A1U7V931_NICSY|nr:PREDICTED: probable purine permease 9 [Nicotiana sylvestris]